MKTHEILPVIISIAVIILVAVLQRYSKLFAAITATMPLTLPLALWVVYSASQGDRLVVQEFTTSLLIGIIPTMAFGIAVWLAARWEMKLVPMLLFGYAVWGILLLGLTQLRRVLGA